MSIANRRHENVILLVSEVESEFLAQLEAPHELQALAEVEVAQVAQFIRRVTLLTRWRALGGTGCMVGRCN